MKTFFLDLASNEGTLACVTESDVPAFAPIDHRVNDAELPGLLNGLLRKAGWTLKDLTHLVCATGPGGFTSLRVAVASVNALSYALKIPAAGIHLSDLYAARIVSHESSVLWLHSTKKTQLFARGFGEAKAEFPEAVVLSIDDLTPRLQASHTWMGELIPEQRTVIDKAGLLPAELKSLKDVLPSALSGLAYSSRQLEPWYGRGW